MFILRSGVFVPVEPIDEVHQPNNRTSLEVVKIDGTEEIALVPYDQLIPPFSQVGDEVKVSVHYRDSGDNNRPNLGGFDVVEVKRGPVRTTGIVRTLPAYDNTHHNQGWYQVVQSKEDGTIHIIAVNNISQK